MEKAPYYYGKQSFKYLLYIILAFSTFIILNVLSLDGLFGDSFFCFSNFLFQW